MDEPSNFLPARRWYCLPDCHRISRWHLFQIIPQRQCPFVPRCNRAVHWDSEFSTISLDTNLKHYHGVWYLIYYNMYLTFGMRHCHWFYHVNTTTLHVCPHLNPFSTVISNIVMQSTTHMVWRGA